MTITIGKPSSPQRAAYIAAFNQQYHPCENGLHVCGHDNDAGLPCGPHFTVLNVSLHEKVARKAFDLAKPAFECPKNEGDVLVELRVGGNTIKDFWMKRQMVEVMERQVRI